MSLFIPPNLMVREYTSRFDRGQHFIFVQKPHVKFYGGMWHCQMSRTMQCAGLTMGSAWLNWFENNRHDAKIYAYMHRLPKYSGLRLSEILTMKGIR